MNEKTKKILPIAIIAGIAALIIAIMVIVIEVKKPRETRAPATITVYYNSYDENGACLEQEQFLCEIKRPDNLKGSVLPDPIRASLPYTGGAYWFTYKVNAETKERYGEEDWYVYREGYVDLEGNNESIQFWEMKEKGVYDISVVIRSQSKVLIPLDATLLITVE